MTTKNGIDSGALALLVEKVLAEGGNELSLRALVEEASELGAARALAKLGLEDRAAGDDIHELRALLTGWHDVRRSVRRILLGWILKLMLSAMLIGLAVELKLGRLIGLGGD